MDVMGIYVIHSRYPDEAPHHATTSPDHPFNPACVAELHRSWNCTLVRGTGGRDIGEFGYHD